MKATVRFLVWGALLLMLLAACATTDVESDKRKAIAEDNQRLGDAYVRQGDYTRALRYYLEAAKYDPDDAQLQYSLGMAYREKENHQRAIEHFNRALALNPDMMPAKNSLGVAYIQTGDYDKAISILRQMIEDQNYEIYMTPQYPKYNLGWAYYQTGNYLEAERYLQAALDYYTSGIPKDAIYVKALRALGLTALAQNNSEEARRHIEEALQLAPKWAHLYLDLARIHRLEGNAFLARQAYQRVIELAPQSDLAATAAQEAASL